MRRAAAAWLLLLLALACSDRRHYTVRGIVEDVDREYGQVLISHEDIPGLMPAMTMNFAVRDPALLERLQKRQAIEFELEVTPRSYTLVGFEVLGDGAELASELSLEEVAVVRGLAPDFSLVDQDGERLALSDLRGRAVVLDFVYTRCPGPCPILTGTHVALQKQLPQELRQHTWFVSISLDPAYDTPERLRRYAEARGADLSDWSFLGGPPQEVDAVVRAYGVGKTPGPDGQVEHVVATFLVDPEGAIAERYVGLDHEPEELLRDLERVTRVGDER